MIKISVILTILFFHFLGDTILQSSAMAKNKHKSHAALFKHAISYTIPWLLPAYFWTDGNWALILAFMCITFGMHSALDYITCRMRDRCEKAQEERKKCVVMGIDQMLHYAQLFLTYLYIMH